MGLGNDTTVEIGHSRMTIRLANVQLMILAGMAAGVVFSVWLTTRDLSTQVGALAMNVGALRTMLDDHEKRIRSTEISNEVTSAVQNLVLEVLKETAPDALRRSLQEQ